MALVYFPDIRQHAEQRISERHKGSRRRTSASQQACAALASTKLPRLHPEATHCGKLKNWQRCRAFHIQIIRGLQGYHSLQGSGLCNSRKWKTSRQCKLLLSLTLEHVVGSRVLSSVCWSCSTRFGLQASDVPRFRCPTEIKHINALVAHDVISRQTIPSHSEIQGNCGAQQEHKFRVQVSGVVPSRFWFCAGLRVRGVECSPRSCYRVYNSHLPCTIHHIPHNPYSLNHILCVYMYICISIYVYIYIHHIRATDFLETSTHHWRSSRSC